jgi:hypothetical protein
VAEDKARDIQPGQSFTWHAIRHTLTEVVQPDVTHVSTHSGGTRHCRWVTTDSEVFGTTRWLLPDDDDVMISSEGGETRG